MGVYVRHLLLGQYYFDTLFPCIPILVMRTIVINLGNMKLPTKHCGVTGETTSGSEETARRPPSVKAALPYHSASGLPFYRASTRGSSPIRRTFTPSLTEMIIQSAPLLSVVAKAVTSQIEIGSRVSDHDRERDHERDRDRYRRSEYDMGSRNLYRRNYDKRQSRCQSRSSPSRNTTKEKTSSNLEKLKDLYGDLSSQKEDEDKISPRPSETEEVIRLGGSSWRLDRSSMFK